MLSAPALLARRDGRVEADHVWLHAAPLHRVERHYERRAQREVAAVRELDQTAFNEIEESPLPAFLKLDPPNCAACHLFNPFWASWADAADNLGLEGRVWRVDCGVHQAVCKDRQVAHNGDESNFASAPDASARSSVGEPRYCSSRDRGRCRKLRQSHRAPHTSSTM